jgi:hypothetical protein
MFRLHYLPQVLVHSQVLQKNCCVERCVDAFARDLPLAPAPRHEGQEHLHIAGKRLAQRVVVEDEASHPRAKHCWGLLRRTIARRSRDNPDPQQRGAAK